MLEIHGDTELSNMESFNLKETKKDNQSSLGFANLF